MEVGFVMKSLLPGFLERKARELDQCCLPQEGDTWRTNVYKMQSIRNVVYASLTGIAALFYLYKTEKWKPISSLAFSFMSGGICCLMKALNTRAIAYKTHIKNWDSPQ